MKRMSLFIVFLVIAEYLFAIDSVQTLQNGMKVSPKNGAAKTIEIGVVNSRIIRVQASPERVLPDVSSLCVLPGLTTRTPFKVTYDARFAELSTDELTVKVFSAYRRNFICRQIGEGIASGGKRREKFRPLCR